LKQLVELDKTELSNNLIQSIALRHGCGYSPKKSKRKPHANERLKLPESSRVNLESMIGEAM